MAEKRTIRIIDPGTTNFYDVELTETSRTVVAPTDRVTEIIKYVILNQEEDGLSATDAATVAATAAAAMKSDGDI